MPPIGWSITGISGKKASIAWTSTSASCKRRSRRSGMDARTSTAAEAEERELVITRIFDAPRRLVFQAWTEPDRVARWWGPQGFVTTHCDMGVRPGGAFRFCMRSPEGTEYWKRGVYREVVEPERLVFTFAWEDADGKPGHQTLVTVTFAERGDKTELTLHQAVFETIVRRDEHQRGWASALERFAAYLASEHLPLPPLAGGGGRGAGGGGG